MKERQTDDKLCHKLFLNDKISPLINNINRYIYMRHNIAII
jgi:hypothetical protein